MFNKSGCHIKDNDTYKDTFLRKTLTIQCGYTTYKDTLLRKHSQFNVVTPQLEDNTHTYLYHNFQQKRTLLV